MSGKSLNSRDREGVLQIAEELSDVSHVTLG